jgi:ABC-type multidrug transport system ATPase subunit
MAEPVLEVVNVRKRYGPTVALDGVSLAVEAGELFGLLGPNGAGKTTLISILCGLTEADSGEVRLFGQPFNRSRRDLRRLVGIGTQDLSIYPDLSARENLRFFHRASALCYARRPLRGEGRTGLPPCATQDGPSGAKTIGRLRRGAAVVRSTGRKPCASVRPL